MHFLSNHVQKYCGGITLLFFWVALSGCADVIHKKAITRDEALKLVDFPLPESATNIYFFQMVDGLQYLQRYARFHLSETEFDSAIDAMVANNNAQFQRHLHYTRQELPAGDYDPQVVEDEKLTWWTPNTIAHGYYRGELEAYALQIWVDEEHARIYLYQSD